MRRRHGNRQRPDITSTHFRRTHPVALSPGTYPELRYLPHTIRYSSIGNGHCAGGKYGVERPCAYGGKMTSPCLQTFVVAPSTSGKRYTITGTPVGRTLSWWDPKADGWKYGMLPAWKIKVRSVGAKERAKTEAPMMPPDKMFLIPGNNTGTGILQNLIDSDGTGLICESEADTISTAIGSEYGHWSDTMRKAFDHDRISLQPTHRPWIPWSEKGVSCRTPVRTPPHR